MIKEILAHTVGLQVLLTLACMSIINRAAGSELYDLKTHWNLRGKSLFYTLPFVFAIVFFWYQNWRIAAAWTFAFGFWRIFAWGRWIDLNTMPGGYNRQGIEPLWYEKVIDRISGGNDNIALWLRHLFILPGMILVDYLTDEVWLTLSSPVIAAALLAGYQVPKRLQEGRDTNHIAEYACGVIWGALFLIDLGV